MKKLTLTLLAITVIGLAGCTTESAEDLIPAQVTLPDAVETTTDSATSEATQESDTEETDGGVETSVEVDSTTSTQDGDEVEEDLSSGAEAEWVTYTNDEYRFSFDHPEVYQVSMNSNGIISFINDTQNFSLKMFIREGVITTSMTEYDALRFEDGRSFMPLVSEETVTINSLLANRVFRQNKKGDLLYPNSDSEELVEVTSTAIEYNYINGKDIIRAWFTIKGDEYYELVEYSDRIASSLKLY